MLPRPASGLRHQAHLVVLTHNPHGRISPRPMFSLSVALSRLPHVEVEGVADIGCAGSKLEKKVGLNFSFPFHFLLELNPFSSFFYN
jgi:hypothetical protein